MGMLVNDLLIILAAGLVAGLACRQMRVSVIVGYLVVGVVIGQGVLGWVSGETHEIEYIAEAGVYLLLFSIGLEFSLDELWRLGRSLLVGGSVQMLLVAVPVFGILIALGQPPSPAAIIALAASFSSTVLVFKALSEWGHASLPHGRRAIGILLFQDAALIPILLMVPLLTGGEAHTVSDYVILAATSTIFVGSIVALRRLLAHWLIPLFAGVRSPELIVLFTLVSLGGVTLAAYRAGLPPAIGAFAAGLIFSGNRWTHQIDALVLPFRETFAAVFFVSLGLLFNPTILLSEPALFVVCLAGLLLVKSMAAIGALRLTGLAWRSAIGMGIGLAHVGEFAFVVVMLATGQGILTEDDYNRVVAIAIGSLILTPLLLRIGLQWSKPESQGPSTATKPQPPRRFKNAALIVGAGPIGRQVASQLETSGTDVCLVDLSPVNLHGFAQQGFRTVAGDATDAATLEMTNIHDAGLVIVCVPDDETAIHIVRVVRSLNSDCLVFVRCRYRANSNGLRKSGANEIVSEETQTGEALLRLLYDFRDRSEAIEAEHAACSEPVGIAPASRSG